MAVKSGFRPGGPGVLVRTVYRVRCDHPSGGSTLVYGENVTFHTGPTAEADARIRAAELAALGRTGIAVHRQEHRKVRLAGQRVDRDRFVWTEVS